MLIGVTGKICAGKDFLCTILENQGCHQINLDAIGHLALDHKQEAIFQAFPELLQLPTPDNTQKKVDRKKLGDLVFRNPASLHKLEGILHPHMKKLVLQELKDHGHTSHLVSGEHTDYMDCQENSLHLILNAAILEKLGLLPLCNLVLWVDAPLWLRVLRGWQRDRISLKKFLQRNWAQNWLKAPSQTIGEGKGGRDKEQPTPVYRIKNHKIWPKTALPNILGQLRQIPQFQQLLGDK